MSSTDALAYQLDGIAPSLVATPASEAEAAEMLAQANNDGRGVVVWGAGTQIAIGNVPDRYDVALLTEKLDAIVEHRPSDLVVSAQAGVRLHNLQTALAAHGQYLPWNPPNADASIGGIVATNAASGWRFGHGTPRDLLLAVRAVTADGMVFKGGAKVVKSVAGYDMPRLLCNSWGTLALITEVTLKTKPTPAARARLRILCPPDRLEQVVAELLDSDLECDSLDWVSNKPLADSWLIVEVSGAEKPTEWQRDELYRRWQAESAAEAPSVQQAMSEVAQWALGVRYVSSSTNGVRLATQLADVEGSRIVAHAGSGIVYGFHRDVSCVHTFRSAADNVGARYCFIQIPTDLKRQTGVWHDPTGINSLHTRIKESFDPRHTLAPGRYLVPVMNGGA